MHYRINLKIYLLVLLKTRITSLERAMLWLTELRAQNPAASFAAPKFRTDRLQVSFWALFFHIDANSKTISSKMISCFDYCLYCYQSQKWALSRLAALCRSKEQFKGIKFSSIKIFCNHFNSLTQDHYHNALLKLFYCATLKINWANSFSGPTQFGIPFWKLKKITNYTQLLWECEQKIHKQKQW